MTNLNPSAAEQVTLLTPKELLDGTKHYLIPMYQRNYAWGNSEIEQLIVDIMDAQIDAKNSKEYKNYYLGTLVVFDRPQLFSKQKVYEVIDGQQRFTTLSLLIMYLKNYFVGDDSNYDMSWYQAKNIEFESRPKSTQTLELLLDGKLQTSEHIDEDKLNPAIINGYKSISEVIKSRFITPNNENQQPTITLEAFCDYLFKYVKIARVPVPDDTDLNHYFEVMNNRGEQLEKHEIIKARLLSIVEKADENEMALSDKQPAKALIHDVWEACANMNKYVQYGFNPTLRFKLFSNSLTLLQPKDFNELLAIYKGSDTPKKSQSYIEQYSDREGKPKPPSLFDILDDDFIKPPNPNKTADKDADDGNSETYYSLVNFSSFLLHALRIMVNVQSSYKQDIALDDKQLLTQFETYILTPSSLEDFQNVAAGQCVGTNDQVTPLSQVKTFIYTLLKSKFIFDHFIIKRNTQDSKGQWTLNKLIKNENRKNSYYKNSFEHDNDKDNDKLVMLQSAFHVSTPTTNYKHWLNAVLYYGYMHYQHDDMGLDSVAYISHLEEIARAFMLRRYLTDEPDDYHQIIYQTSDANKRFAKHTHDNLSADNLRTQIMQHLRYGKIRNIFVFNYLDYLLWLNGTYPKFTFTARSSVEHFYPQNKRNDSIFFKDKNEKDALLHSFGNLCLISHSLNSRVSNDMPDVKVKYFLQNGDMKSGKIDSLKLLKMIKFIKDEEAIWDKNMIAKHETEMLEVLMKGLNLADVSHE